MTTDVRTALEANPAWPTLLGVQAVVVAALVGLVWSHRPTPPEPLPPIEERLLAMDLPAAGDAVERAIEGASSRRALSVDDQRHLASFLALAATAARLDVRSVKVEAQEPQGGLQAVDARVDLGGDAWDLPVFLDAVHLHRATARLERVTVQVEPGGQVDAQVTVRFHRPASTDTAWLTERLDDAAPGVDAALPVLERAAVLAAWRRYDAQEHELLVAASRSRRDVARALPGPLVGLRRLGGHLTWTADDGLAIR